MWASSMTTLNPGFTHCVGVVVETNMSFREFFGEEGEVKELEVANSKDLLQL